MKIIQRVTLISEGDVTIDVNEVPVLDNVESASNQLRVINFLRCGCPAVQATHNKGLQNRDPDAYFVRNLEEIQASLNAFARYGEKFMVEDTGVFQTADCYNENHVIQITRSVSK